MPKPKVCKFCRKPFVFSNYHECQKSFPNEIKNKLERIWFTYGNHGPRSTNANHKFIQRLIEGKISDAVSWINEIEKDCEKAVFACCGVKNKRDFLKFLAQ